MAAKILIGLLILGVVGLFFIKGPNGEPILSLSDMLPEAPEAGPSGPTKVYKWRDENGVWQFSNEPVDREGVEVIEVDGNVNIMQAVETRPTSSSSDGTAGSLLPGSMDQLTEANENVKALQEAMDKQQKALDEVAPPGGDE